MTAPGREEHDELCAERRHGGKVEGQLRHAQLVAVREELPIKRRTDHLLRFRVRVRVIA